MHPFIDWDIRYSPLCHTACALQLKCATVVAASPSQMRYKDRERRPFADKIIKMSMYLAMRWAFNGARYITAIIFSILIFGCIRPKLLCPHKIYLLINSYKYNRRTKQTKNIVWKRIASCNWYFNEENVAGFFFFLLRVFGRKKISFGLSHFIRLWYRFAEPHCSPYTSHQLLLMPLTIALLSIYSSRVRAHNSQAQRTCTISDRDLLFFESDLYYCRIFLPFPRAHAIRALHTFAFHLRRVNMVVWRVFVFRIW